MKKKHKKRLNKYLTRILIFVLIPIILYLLIFGSNGLSFKSTNWSEFGSFIGGYGTLIFSAANLYFLIKVAYTINHLDEKRNKQNKIDSVKPLASINTFLSLTKNYVTIEIHNNGLGPLKIKEIKYTIEDKTFNNIIDLIHDNLSISNLRPKFRANNIVNGAVIPINSKIDILYLELDENSNLAFEKSNLENALTNRIVTELNKIKTEIIYTDIHDSKIYILKDNS
ncbi:hypothetical protein [Empedobacter sp. UBA7248]|uniref:hypothetical protein n=1 Tax=Empedobacter sp. UBA7248 TaxID=1946448 RepID=UPI0025C6DED6|nr:hypothetical protein [Empedobacter sp. UBA7248]